MGLDFYKALRVLAFSEARATTSSNAYALRKVLRWYSKTFATPLHVVETLPVDDILQHYYESLYEDMDLEDEARELADLVMTEKEAAVAAEKLAKKTAEEDAFVKEVEAEEAARKAKAKTAPKAPAPPKPGRETDLPEAVAPPADIRMTFLSEDELERLDAEDGLGAIAPLVGLD